MSPEPRISALLKARDYGAAAEALERHLRANPGDEQAWLQLIDCLERSGSAKLEQGVGAAVRALPASEPIASARAAWLAAAGREAEACAALPANAPSSVRLRLLERLGRQNDAIAFALDELGHGFDPACFGFALDRLIGAGRIDEAVELCAAAPLACSAPAHRTKAHALALFRKSDCRPAIADVGLATLAQVIDEAGITVLDVGGRGANLGALATFAPFMDYVVCEPESGAREQLATAARGRAPWRTIQVSSHALGRCDGPALLHVTAKGGLSSLYEPDAAMFAAVGMADRAAVERTFSVDVRRLDTLVVQSEFPSPSILKLDVQGAELDVLEGAGTVLESVGAILLEMEHRAFYKGQPVFADVDAALRNWGFELIDFDVSRLGDVDRGISYARPRPVWSHAFYVAAIEDPARNLKRAIAAAAALAAFHQFALARALLQRAMPNDAQLLLGVDLLRERAAMAMTAKEIAAAKLFALPALTALWPPHPRASR